MQIYTIAKNVLGALGGKVKVPVLDSELKLPAECMRIVGALDAGSIIEQGSNANGRYTKWADGTMLCINTPTLASYVIPIGTTLVGSWLYPASFISPPAISLTYDGGYGDYLRAMSADVSSTYLPVWLLNTYSQVITLTIRFSEIAIGRWKA